MALLQKKRTTVLGILCISLMIVSGCDCNKTNSPAIDLKHVVDKDNIVPAVIIGSGPAGWSAALYFVWSNIQTLVITGPKRGGLLTETSWVENFPGKIKAQGPEIIESLEKQVTTLSEKVSLKGSPLIEFLDDEVTTIDFSSWPYTLHTSQGHQIRAMTIVLATGASPKWLGVPGDQEYRKKGVTTCAVCDGGLYKDKNVVVVGGGDSAAEQAMQLSRIAKHVTVLVRKEHMRAGPTMQKKIAEIANIKILYNREIKQVLGDGESVTKVEIYDHTTKKSSIEPMDGVFIAIGHTPNSGVVKEALDVDEQGYVKVFGRTQETSMPGVFAAGEVEDRVYRQAGVASGNGIKAALDAIGFLNNIGFGPEIAKKIEKNYFKVSRVKSTGEGLQIITSMNEFKTQVEDSSGVVVVDFFRDNCGGCVSLAPKFEAVAQEMADKAQFIKVDVKPALDIAQKYVIKYLPTIIIFNKGKLAARYQGDMSKADLTALVEKVVSGQTVIDQPDKK